MKRYGLAFLSWPFSILLLLSVDFLVRSSTNEYTKPRSDGTAFSGEGFFELLGPYPIHVVAALCVLPMLFILWQVRRRYAALMSVIFFALTLLLFPWVLLFYGCMGGFGCI